MSTALVTGASRGIGAAIAFRFAAEGAKVVITARTVEPDGKLPGSLRETADRIAALGAEVLCVQADLSDPEARARIVPAAVERFGGVDILVNNAAWVRYQAIPDIAPETLERMLDVGLKAVIWSLQEAAAVMDSQRGGVIVNVASVAALRSAVNSVAYSDGMSSERFMEIVATIPLRRAGKPLDIANACLFLASELSAYITGTTLDVNGGSHIH